MNDDIKNLINTIKNTLSLLYKTITKHWSLLFVFSFYWALYKLPQFEEFKKEMIFTGDGASFLGLFLSIVVLFIFLIVFYFSRKNNKSKKWKLINFLILLYLYTDIIHYNAFPMGMLNPFCLTFLFVGFLFFIYEKKYFNLYIFIFFAIPLLNVAYDRIVTSRFLETCDAETPKAVFNPIYLPDKFFHEEIIDGKKELLPNVVVNAAVYDAQIEREKQEFKENYIYI